VFKQPTLGEANVGDKPELQTRLQEALGLADSDFAYHATDLYVLAKPGVHEWLKVNYAHFANVRGFMGAKGSAWAGQAAYDIPFAGNWRK
jgi:hypothetical protein